METRENGMGKEVHRGEMGADEGKARRSYTGVFRLGIILSCVVVVAGSSIAQADVVVVDFDGVLGDQDFLAYSEDGFTFETNIGEVRIHDAFSDSMAAHPTFGFGQGVDSHFMVARDVDEEFDVLSIDLLEATGVPEAFGITMTGTKADFGTVSQTFTLDGIPGAETFWLATDFAELISLEIGEDVGNSFSLEKVAIDNVTFGISPEPVTGLLVLLGGLGLLRRRGGRLWRN